MSKAGSAPVESGSKHGQERVLARKITRYARVHAVSGGGSHDCKLRGTVHLRSGRGTLPRCILHGMRSPWPRRMLRCRTPHRPYVLARIASHVRVGAWPTAIKALAPRTIWTTPEAVGASRVGRRAGVIPILGTSPPSVKSSPDRAPPTFLRTSLISWALAHFGPKTCSARVRHSALARCGPSVCWKRVDKAVTTQNKRGRGRNNGGCQVGRD